MEKRELFRNKLKLFLLMPIVSLLAIFVASPVANATPLTCNMSTVSGDDDGSFRMDLPFSLQLGSTNYNQVYYSTNGLMSFGQPDGNFWDYPTTPSVTLAGRDWVSFGPGAYTSYGYNETSFCIEWSVRPFPQSSGDLTQIRLVVNRFANGGWHGEITTLGWIPQDIRRGIRYDPNQPVILIEAAFDVNGGVPIEVPPAPAPTSLTEPPAIPTQCWDGSTIYAPATCPTEPSYTCWNGQITHYSSECLPTPPPIQCWNGTTVPWNQSCPNVPPPVECWDGSSVNWDAQCPIRTLNPPENINGEVRSDGVYISWDAPIVTATSVERYAVSWICEGCAGYGWTSNTTSVLIPFSTFTYTGGVGRNYTFSIRSDNDTTATYSSYAVGPVLFVEEPTPMPSPEPSQSQVVEPTPLPTTSPLQPEPTPLPTQPSSTPTPNPSSSLSESQLPLPVSPATQSPTPEPQTSSPSPEALSPSESPSPDPSSSTNLPSDNLTTEQAVEQILSEYDSQEAVPSDALEELGLDYSDLPPDQPVMLDNGVILTAEVADALQLFENPSEILSTVLTDPGKAVKAFLSVGADMTSTERHQSTQAIVAAVIAGQLMNALSAANTIGRKL